MSGKKTLVISLAMYLPIFIISIVVSVTFMQTRQNGVPTFFGNKYITIDSASMNGGDGFNVVIREGEAIVIKSVDPQDIDIGDIITFRFEDQSDIVTITHRVIEILSANSVITGFVTQGDNNPNIVETVSVSAVLGRYERHVSRGWADFVTFLSGILGLAIFVLIPLAAVIIICIFALTAKDPAKKEEPAPVRTVAPQVRKTENTWKEVQKRSLAEFNKKDKWRDV
jgi:signal peptidase